MAAAALCMQGKHAQECTPNIVRWSICAAVRLAHADWTMIQDFQILTHCSLLPLGEGSHKLFDFSDSLQQVGHKGGAGCQAAVGQHQPLQLSRTAHQGFTVVGVVVGLLPQPAIAAH